MVNANPPPHQKKKNLCLVRPWIDRYRSEIWANVAYVGYNNKKLKGHCHKGKSIGLRTWTPLKESLSRSKSLGSETLLLNKLPPRLDAVYSRTIQTQGRVTHLSKWRTRAMALTLCQNFKINTSENFKLLESVMYIYLTDLRLCLIMKISRLLWAFKKYNFSLDLIFLIVQCFFLDWKKKTPKNQVASIKRLKQFFSIFFFFYEYSKILRTSVVKLLTNNSKSWEIWSSSEKKNSQQILAIKHSLKSLNQELFQGTKKKNCLGGHVEKYLKFP